LSIVEAGKRKWRQKKEYGREEFRDVSLLRDGNIKTFPRLRRFPGSVRLSFW
jgi:hypothetical protein